MQKGNTHSGRKHLRINLEGATSEGDRLALLDRKKYHALLISVFANVFKLIYDANNFNSTMQKLDEAFIKSTNII